MGFQQLVHYTLFLAYLLLSFYIAVKKPGKFLHYISAMFFLFCSLWSLLFLLLTIKSIDSLIIQKIGFGGLIINLNISHEVRTPINSIVGFGNLILTDEDKINDQKRYIKLIKNSNNS